MFPDLLKSVASEISSALQAIFMVSSSRHFWLYMLSYIVIAVVLYWMSRDRSEGGSLLRFIFPREIYTHPSVIMDLKFWLVIVVVVNIGLFGLLYTAVGIFSGLLERGIDLLGPGWSADRGGDVPGFGDRVVYTLIVTCCIDFGFFIMHFCQHKISWLWSFHKVHHSAEVLTPLTANRHHPVDYILGAATAIFLGSIGTVVFSRYHGVQIDGYTILNTSAIHFVYYMSANMRHSHLWLSFGPWISKVFVSPAMHQVHHSVDDQHFDKNFGFVFSFWDRLFGCRYIALEKESIVVGLRPGERPYSGFIDAMVRPFSDSIGQFGSIRRWRRLQYFQDGLK